MVEITAKESPFTPGRPVPVEYFVARIKEIQRLERAIGQTILGKNENVFICGHRGIGKSSLAAFVRYLAEKKYNFLGSHCYLGGVKGLEEMAGVIFQKLLQDCTDKSLFDKLREGFGNYVKSLSLFGVEVEFTKDKSDLRTLVDNFLPVMRKVHEKAKENNKEGIILILDDLNGITDIPQFSQFLKSFVDGLATSGKPLPLLLVLVGLPERRTDIIKHQPSTARVFSIIDLPLMTHSESEDFFINMFGKQSITCDSDAVSLMAKFSGGYPMLLHEIGDAVFWEDTDNKIDSQDSADGILEAAENVGQKYIDNKVRKVIKNSIYSSLLIKICDALEYWDANFKRKDILKEGTEEEQKNLDNFLQKVKDLGIVIEADNRGEYKFANPLYSLYLYGVSCKLTERKGSKIK